MAFCGQCGLLLAPGTEACPRCGYVTEPDLALEAPYSDDDPTRTLRPPDTPRPAGDVAPHQQQKLVIRPDGSYANYDANAAGQNDPTSLMTPEEAMPPISQPPQARRNDILRTPHLGFTPPVDIYQPPMPQQYGHGQGNVIAPSRPHQSGKGRVATLLAILLVLLLALGTVILLVMKSGLLQGITGNYVSPGATTIATPGEQARGVLRRYYDDINKHNYRDAYNLWAVDAQHPAASYDIFVNGFAHTVHDDIVFNSVTPLSNGKVQLDVTLTATEETASGNVLHMYHLYYQVGQEGGVWKILDGHSI